MAILALTRRVPPSIYRCELTHLARAPIDYARAVEEHAAYERALEHLGCRVEHLPDAPDRPDSVFVEDPAIVLDTLAIITRPGAASRRYEVSSVAEALRPHRPLAFIEASATMDGGDVLVTPRGVFVGITPRTSEDGVRQLAAILRRAGLSVTAVPVQGCLHLKSAVTLAGNDVLLLNPDWVDPRVFDGFDILHVDPTEPAAGNVLRLGDRVLCAAEYPRTRVRLESAGIATMTVAAGELAKAEGGLTCCSLLLSDPLTRPLIHAIGHSSLTTDPSQR